MGENNVKSSTSGGRSMIRECTVAGMEGEGRGEIELLVSCALPSVVDAQNGDG